MFGSDSVWLRRGLSLSNNFIPLYMADQLQQPEPGDSVGRGPTADHHSGVLGGRVAPWRADSRGQARQVDAASGNRGRRLHEHPT